MSMECVCIRSLYYNVGGEVFTKGQKYIAEECCSGNGEPYGYGLYDNNNELNSYCIEYFNGIFELIKNKTDIS
jgi:hypothetical protein